MNQRSNDRHPWSASCLGLIIAATLAGCATEMPRQIAAPVSPRPVQTDTVEPLPTGEPAATDSTSEAKVEATPDSQPPGVELPGTDLQPPATDPAASIRLIIFNASRYRMGVVRFADAAECKGIVSTDGVPAGDVLEWALPAGQPFSFGGRFMSAGPRQGRCLSYATFTPEPNRIYQAFWRASEEDGRCAITLVDKTIMDETGVMRDALVPYEIRTPAFPDTRQGAFCAPSGG
ncbi:hypothetical protein [Hydrogenophaga sp. 5NK40-0174]|uniref:hypothetical protein n=1 Tax=Hydrogenophaga sp. 5NK40-0174 TaxID=3127649 RepID=UPI003102D1CB